MAETPTRYVREGRVGDAPFIGNLQAVGMRELLQALVPQVNWSQQIPVAPIVEAWDETLQLDPVPQRGVVVAQENGMPVGFVSYAPVTIALRTVGTEQTELVAAVEILALEVDPGVRRQGHASRMLAAVADTTRAQGATRLCVWAPAEDQPRIQFWQSLGFSPAGQRRLFAVADDTVTQYLWQAQL